MSGIGASDTYLKQVGWPRLNCSCCPSVAANPSLESCDSPLNEKVTLPTVEQPTVKGVLFKMARTHNFDLRGNFGRSTRLLARLRMGDNWHTQKHLISSLQGYLPRALWTSQSGTAAG